MPDVKEVINGLEMSYKYSNVDENNTLVPQQLVLDALALLKEQEPVEPKHEDDRPISPLRCGNCGAFILVTNDYKAKYCFEYGREVRWT